MLLVHLLIYLGVPLRGRRQRGASPPNVSGCFCNSWQKFQSGGVTALNRSLRLTIMVDRAWCAARVQVGLVQCSRKQREKMVTYLAKLSAVQLLRSNLLVLQPLVHGKIFALDAYSIIPWNHMIMHAGCS